MIRLALILLFIPMVAVAQSVTIRSGEHATFSRLVLSMGSITQWELEQASNTIVVRLDGASDGFDISQVFNRIPRDRISEVIQIAPDALRLTLACPCDYDAFLWKPGELVLDIIDREVQATIAPVSRPEQIMPRQPQSVINMGAPPLNAAPVLPSILVLEQSTQDVTPDLSLMSRTPPSENDLSATENALAEGIARAASQGFLDPSIAQLDDNAPNQRDIQAEAPIIDNANPPHIPNRPGIGISTAMDRDLALVGAAIERSIDQQCLPADLFQIDEWGSTEAFHAQVAALAEALAGEFGEEPLQAQESLARLYINFGFGAEARLVLSADTASSRSRLVLFELAGIVDNYEEDYPLISSQDGCPTPAALWAFLINPTSQDEGSRNQLMQQFFALPNPLRGQIAPRLVRDFLDIGESDAAERLLSSVEWTDAGAAHEIASARALFAERTDDPAGALAVLSREADENPRTSPQSLIRFIELQLEQGLSPADADLLLVASFRTEYEGSLIEQQLADVEAKGLAVNGRYQFALDLMVGRDDDVSVSITNDVFTAIANDADAGVFLEYAYGETPDILTPETENAMAARLIDLGFPDRASTFLIGSATREAAAERRYLRAEAAVGTSDYEIAIDSLLGMEDDRARALRARAYEGLGEYRAALASLNPDQPDSSPTLQFRASAWERLTVQDDEVLSSFAQVVLDPAGNDAVDTLADRRAILAQAQESRRAVENLLLRFDGTTPQE